MAEEERRREGEPEPTPAVAQPRAWRRYEQLVEEILDAVARERDRLLLDERPALPPDLESAYGSPEYPRFIDDLCYPYIPRYTKEEARLRGRYHAVVDRYLVVRIVQGRSTLMALQTLWDVLATPAFCYSLWRGYRVLSFSVALQIAGCAPAAMCLEVITAGMVGPALFCIGRDKAIVAVARHVKPAFVVTPTDVFDPSFKALDDAVVFCDKGNLKRIKVYSSLL